MPANWDDLEPCFNPPGPAETNIVLRSKPGIGKTTLLAGNPTALMVSCETGGAEAAVGSRARQKILREWPDFHDLMARLETDAKEDARQFTTVCIDTIGQFAEKFAYPYWCSKNGCTEVEGFDWPKAAKFLMNFLRKLNNMGYAWHVTDHLIDKVIKSTTGAEKIITESVLPNTLIKLLDQECSYILTLELVQETKDARGQSLPLDKRPWKCIASTKPGRKTSLANPKTRIWLPDTFEVPILNGWKYFEEICQTGRDQMLKAHEEVLASVN